MDANRTITVVTMLVVGGALLIAGTHYDDTTLKSTGGSVIAVALSYALGKATANKIDK